MSGLYLFRRASPGPPDDLWIARSRSAPDGWTFRRKIDVAWTPGRGGDPYCAWRRRRPRPGHMVTTGHVPRGAGDWSLDFVFYAARGAGVPVDEVRRPPVRPELEMALVKPLFLDLLDILNAHDFPYWADCGTLLGTMRHRGIIPWDKDCDLGIRREHRRALVRLIRSSAPGFGVMHERSPTMWIVSSKYGVRVTDVFTYSFKRRFRAAFWHEHAAKYRVDPAKGFLVYDHASFRRLREQRFNIPWSLFHPVRWAPFYDRRIKVPHRARTLLKGLYGDRCFTHASSDGLNSEGPALTTVRAL